VSKLEQDIMREVLIALGQRDDVIIWRQNTGAATFGGVTGEEMKTLLATLCNSSVPLAKKVEAAIRSLREWITRATNYVRFGMKGQADCTGVLILCTEMGNNIGVRLEVETKSEKGRQTTQQKDFAHMMKSAGVIYLLVRSADDAVQQLEMAKGQIEVLIK
jgi:hypothetical protein